MINKEKIKTIAFDADDTLWVNEPNYQRMEHQFCELMATICPKEILSKELLQTEVKNIELYGYGAKSFVLSMIETALNVSKHDLDVGIVAKIIDMGKQLIDRPVELIDDVRSVLESLKPEYRLVLATKGDLSDQKRKIEKSSLSGFFDHIEIMNEKNEGDYMQLLSKLNCKPEEFTMVGNSMKSDIIPVVGIGATAVYIPFHTTWQYEKTEAVDIGRYITLQSIAELKSVFRSDS
jgi:putative hydrolase of the HAD superfamily